MTTQETAAALICAVSDRDRDEVRRVLASRTRHDLAALATFLAAHIPEDAPLTEGGQRSLTPEEQADRAITEAAQRFACRPEAVTSASRVRNASDARAVAMAALRLVGHTSVAIGTRFNRDHSTVLYACSRVGENAKLRRISRAIADQIGERGWLGDEDEEAA